MKAPNDMLIKLRGTKTAIKFRCLAPASTHPEAKYLRFHYQ